ncbi:MAG TPA: hypothetical protein VIJ72_01180, partial [Rhizomicrobium sp.]
DHARAFSAYEEKLHPFLLRQQDQAKGFASSFTPKTKFGVGLRNLVLNAMKFPPLGALLARQMLGERFPLPDYD